MKKLMIAAAIVCAAAFAQASSVSWSITNLSNPSEASTMSAYCFLTSDTKGGPTFDVADVVAAIIAGEDPWATGMDFADVSAGGGSSFGLSGDWAAGDSVHGAVVIFDAEYPNDGAKNYMVLDTGVLTDFQATADQTFHVDASAGEWKAIAVPEPTSGLLLLLGVAGLALRRRRA